MDRSGSTSGVVVALLVAGSALVFDPGGWQAFGPSKWLVITVGAWLAAAATLRNGAPLHRPSLLGWGVILAWAAVTSVIGLDPLSAWLGTPDRRLGVIALLTMAAAYIGGQGVISADGRRLVGRAGIVTLFGLTIYGVAEALGWAPVELTTITDRIGSTFGSPAYLGAALSLLIPIVVGMAADTSGTRSWRVGAGLAVAGGLFLLAASGTRAALVGLAVASLVSVPAWWSSRRRLFLVAAVAAVVVVVSPLGQRLVDSSFQGRLAEWTVAASVLGDNPLTGVGLEGYRTAFRSHVDVGYVQNYGRSTVTDRAHSGPLDMGVALGGPGVAAWVVAAWWVAYRSWRVVDRRVPILTGMAAGVVGLFAQQLFLFPTLEVGGAGWAIAGIVVAAGTGGRPIRSRAGTIVASLVALAALSVGAADVVADHLAASARRDVDPTVADRAASLRPDSFRYPLLAADLAFRADDFDLALDRLDRAARLSPLDPGIQLARARTLHALVTTGERDASPAAALVGRIVAADPNQPELRLIHGDMLATAGRAADAERAWLAAAHLAPDDILPELRLASLYVAADRIRAAREALARARAIDPTHPGLARLEEEIDAA